MISSRQLNATHLHLSLSQYNCNKSIDIYERKKFVFLYPANTRETCSLHASALVCLRACPVRMQPGADWEISCVWENDLCHQQNENAWALWFPKMAAPDSFFQWMNRRGIMFLKTHARQISHTIFLFWHLWNRIRHEHSLSRLPLIGRQEKPEMGRFTQHISWSVIRKSNFDCITRRKTHTYEIIQVCHGCTPTAQNPKARCR